VNRGASAVSSSERDSEESHLCPHAKNVGKIFVRHFDMGGTLFNLDANAMKDDVAEPCEAGKSVLRP
jgi:hypothetical protein